MDQEKGMNERRDQVPGGPAQEEVEEVNKQSLRSADLKPRPLRRPGFLGKIVNTALAVATFGSVAALKAKAEENVVNQTPPQVEPSNNQEIQNTPPAGVVFPENARADAPVPDAPAQGEFKPTHRILIPKVEKNHSEAPLRFLTRIEKPEHKLTIFNRGKERGVKQGELFDNLVGFRRFGRQDLPLEVYFYDSRAQVIEQSGIPQNMIGGDTIVGMPPYDFWARTVNVYDDQGNKIETRQFPPTFQSNGLTLFRLRDSRVMEVHVALPTPLSDVTPDPLQIDQVERMSQSEVFLRIFSLDENGNDVFKREGVTPEIRQYINDHPYVIRKPNQRLDQAALRMILK